MPNFKFFLIIIENFFKFASDIIIKKWDFLRFFQKKPLNFGYIIRVIP